MPKKSHSTCGPICFSLIFDCEETGVCWFDWLGPVEEEVGPEGFGPPAPWSLLMFPRPPPWPDGPCCIGEGQLVDGPPPPPPPPLIGDDIHELEVRL